VIARDRGIGGSESRVHHEILNEHENTDHTVNAEINAGTCGYKRRMFDDRSKSGEPTIFCNRTYLTGLQYSMSNLEQETKPSQIILFRSKLTDEAGEDYQAMNAELETLVRQNPGFVDVKSYKAEDGERLTVVWWRDEASLTEWRNLMRHREAQSIGRQKWYEYYEIDVATITRSRSFARK
jgi:heme-degrading monooxygenase HmoA